MLRTVKDSLLVPLTIAKFAASATGRKRWHRFCLINFISTSCPPSVDQQKRASIFIFFQFDTITDPIRRQTKTTPSSPQCVALCHVQNCRSTYIGMYAFVSLCTRRCVKLYVLQSVVDVVSTGCRRSWHYCRCYSSVLYLRWVFNNNP